MQLALAAYRDMFDSESPESTTLVRLEIIFEAFSNFSATNICTIKLFNII